MRTTRLLLSTVLAVLVLAAASPVVAASASTPSNPTANTSRTEAPVAEPSNGPAAAPNPDDLPDGPSSVVEFGMPAIAYDGSRPAGYVDGVSTEINEARTEFTKTYANPDGTQTRRASLLPLHWNSAGQWVDIDSSVLAERDGFRSASNAWTAHFQPLPKGLTIDTAEGSMEFSPVGANVVAPQKISASEISYPNAWAGADLNYTITAEGVKENIILHQVPSVDRFEFTTNQPFTYDDGALQPADEGTGRLAAAEVLDATGTPLTNTGAQITAVSWAKVAPKLVVTFNRGAIASLPESSYPIAIDPPWVASGQNMINYKSDGFVGCNPCGPHVRFGNSNEPTGPNYWRSVGYFDYHIPDDQYVTAAAIYLNDLEFGSSNSYPVSIYYATAQSWAGAAPTGASPIGTNAVTTGSIIDVTNAYRGWVQAKSWGRYIGFKGAETAGAYTYKGLRTFQLWLTTEYKLKAPSIVASATPTATTSRTPALVAKNEDTRAAYLGVHVFDAAGTYLTGQWCGGANPTLVAAGSSCQITPTLPDADASYWYAFFAYLPTDGYDGYSPYSSAGVITLDRTAPTVTTPIGWPNSPGTWSPYGWNFVGFSASDLSGITGFSYKWDTSASTVPPTTVSTPAVCPQPSTSDPNDWVVDVPTFTPACDGSGTARASDGTYYLHVRARNGAGLWGTTIHIKQQFDRTAPTPPAALLSTCAAPSSSGPKLSVTWTSASDAGAGLRGYSSLWNNSATTAAPTNATNLTPTATGTTSSALADGTWYFHLRALDEARDLAGVSNASVDQAYGPFTVSGGVITASPPSAQFGSLYAGRLTDTTWLTSFLGQPTIPQNILNEGFHSLPTATQAELARCTATALAQSGQVPANLLTPFLDYGSTLVQGLVFGRTYPTTDAIRDVAEPSNIVAVPGDKKATIRWTAPVLGPVEKYQVQLRNAAGAPIGTPKIVTSTISSPNQVEIEIGSDVLPGGLINGTTYRVSVGTTLVGIPTSNSPRQSNDFVPYGVPFAPSITAVSREDHAITVRWAPPATRPDGTPGNNGRNIGKYEARAYRVNVPEDPSDDTLVGVAVLNDPDPALTELQILVEGKDGVRLANGEKHYATVRAYNVAGWSNESTASAVVTPAGLPVAPASASAVEGDTEASVTWPAADFNGGDPKTYTVSAVPGPASATVPATQTHATVPGLKNGTTYRFKVTAKNDVGDSPTSSPLSNPVIPFGKPYPPEHVVASQTVAGLHVTWDAPSDRPDGTPGDNGRRIDHYTVTNTTTGESKQTSGTFADFTGTVGAHYVFSVVATNINGNDSLAASSNDLPFAAACSNRLDDDGDGHIDYPDDPDCSSNSDNNEAGNHHRVRLDVAQVFDPNQSINASTGTFETWINEGIFTSEATVIDWAKDLIDDPDGTAGALDLATCGAGSNLSSCLRPDVRQAFANWGTQVRGGGGASPLPPAQWLAFSNGSVPPLNVGSSYFDSPNRMKTHTQVFIDYDLANGKIDPDSLHATARFHNDDTRMPGFMLDLFKQIEADYGIARPNLTYSAMNLETYSGTTTQAQPQIDGRIPARQLGPGLIGPEMVVDNGNNPAASVGCARVKAVSGGMIGWKVMLNEGHVYDEVDRWADEINALVDAGHAPAVLGKYANEVKKYWFSADFDGPEYVGSPFRKAPPIWSQLNAEVCPDGSVKPFTQAPDPTWPVQMVFGSYMPDTYLFVNGRMSNGQGQASSSPILTGDFDKFSRLPYIHGYDHPWDYCSVGRSFRGGNPWGILPLPSDNNALGNEPFQCDNPNPVRQ